MPLHHIVLLKLKPAVPPAALAAFTHAARAMLGAIPCVRAVDVGPGLPATAHLGKGYDYGVIAVLEAAEDLPAYVAHPAHKRTMEARLEVSDDFLAFDIVSAQAP
ncbi:hypothetical protein Q5752_006472 [Cryptotrichosporon argae]